MRRIGGSDDHFCVLVRRSRLEVHILLKIAAVGIVISLMAQVLKHSGRDEIAFLTQLLGLVLVIGWVLPYIRKLLSEFSRLLSF